MTIYPSDEGSTSKTDREKLTAESSAGGDSACWAHLVCTVCGVMLESEPHLHDDDLEQRD